MTTLLKISLAFLFLGNLVGAFLAPTSLHFTNGKMATVCLKAILGKSDSVLRRSPTSFRMAAGGPAATDSSFLNHPLAALLAECKDFGLVRFISVNPSGSVLETAGTHSQTPMATQRCSLLLPILLRSAHGPWPQGLHGAWKGPVRPALTY